MEVCQDGDTSYAVLGQVAARYHFSRPADLLFLSSCPAADYAACYAPSSDALLEVVPRPFLPPAPAAAAGAGLFRQEMLAAPSAATPLLASSSAAARSTRAAAEATHNAAVERLIKLSPWMVRACVLHARPACGAAVFVLTPV